MAMKVPQQSLLGLLKPKEQPEQDRPPSLQLPPPSLRSEQEDLHSDGSSTIRGPGSPSPTPTLRAADDGDKFPSTDEIEQGRENDAKNALGSKFIPAIQNASAQEIAEAMAANDPFVMVPGPVIYSWNEYFDQDQIPNGDHFYLTEDFLRPGEDFPPLPDKYQIEWEEIRVLSLHGLPDKWDYVKVEKWCSIAGAECELVVALTSFTSKAIYRWAIMKNHEDCQKVMKFWNPVSSKIYAGAAYPPGLMKSAVTQEQIASLRGRPAENTALTQAHPVARPVADENVKPVTASSSKPVPAPINKPVATMNDKPVVVFEQPVFVFEQPVEQPVVASSKPKDTAISASSAAASSKDKLKEVTVEGITAGLAQVKVTPAVPVITLNPAGEGTSASASTIKLEIDNETETKPEAAAAPFVPQAVSWANIAHAANPQVKTINLHPREPRAPRLHPVGRIPPVVSSTKGDTEPLTEQARIIFLLNIPTNMTLEQVSDGIKEGSVMRIQLGTDDNTKHRFAGIIFQYASNAEKFYQVLCKERAEGRAGRYKFIPDVIRGDEPYPACDQIKAMGAPLYASRRLTIVKSQFFDMFGKRHLEAFCDKMVGSENVQLIWLYNIGNATIVFSDVQSARIVKEELDRRAASAGQPGGESMMWKGLSTTYSKDPCYTPLELKTALID